MKWSYIFRFEVKGMCVHDLGRSCPTRCATVTDVHGDWPRPQGLLRQVDPDHLHKTRDDATRLAAPAAAGPTHRAQRTAEGNASLAPDDAGLQHGRARNAGPDARAETRRPCRPTEETTTAG